MEIIKWKLKIKNISHIKKLQIISINQNSNINIVKEETEIYFYSIKNQDVILMNIDDNYFDLPLNDNIYNYKLNNIVKAILQYKKEDYVIYENEKQNILNERYIYSRKYHSLVPEYVSTTPFIIIRDVLNNRYFGNHYILKYITILFAYFVKSNFSSFMIKSFIKQYNIKDYKYIVKGPTFNDFFTRELKKPLDILKNSNIIYSPVSARCMFYNFKNLYKIKLHIKGKNFDLYDLIDNPKRKKYSVIVSRLAVNDYHHAHMPEDGILVKIKEFNGTYYTVDKDYLRTDMDILTENKRILFKFKRDDGSYFYLVMIGAILISSIVHNLQLHKKYYTKEKIAYFQYGGSCVVYVSDKNIYFDEDLYYFNNENIESYIKVGDEVGNITNRKKKMYIKNYHIRKNTETYIEQIIKYIINLMIKINKKYLTDLKLEII
jgi:phosphatidylserine decarboxylase precursor